MGGALTVLYGTYTGAIDDSLIVGLTKACPNNSGLSDDEAFIGQ